MTGEATGEIWTWSLLGVKVLTPRKYPLLPCGHLDCESAVTAQNDQFKGSFDSSSSRSVNVKP